MKIMYHVLVIQLFFFIISINCKGEHNKHQHKMESIEPSGSSLNLLDSHWQTEENRNIRISELTSKKIQVISMIFFNCTNVCPRIVADMRYIQSKLSDKSRGAVEFTLVTVDPDRDTIESFHDFQKKMNIPGWHFLRGNKNDIRELAAVLGVKYVRLDDGNFTHSNIISVLNKKGEIAYQQKEIRSNIQETIDAIEFAYSHP